MSERETEKIIPDGAEGKRAADSFACVKARISYEADDCFHYRLLIVCIDFFCNKIPRHLIHFVQRTAYTEGNDGRPQGFAFGKCKGCGI